METYYDPAVCEVLAEGIGEAPELWDLFMAYYGKVFEEGALTAREKSIIALAVAAAVQCPYCIDAYTNSCLQKGVTEEQMTEAFHVARERDPRRRGARAWRADEENRREPGDVVSSLILRGLGCLARRALALRERREDGHGIHRRGERGARRLPPFWQRVGEYRFTENALDTLQINIGLKCNLACKHCHVESSPARTEEMSRETLKQCLAVFCDRGFKTIDITGGAPEMNPNYEWFLREAVGAGASVMTRART